jgi:hypothetical protein
MQAPNIVVDTVPGFAMGLLERAGIPTGDAQEAGFWKDLPLRAACDALPKLGDVCDAVVLDEVQDLGENDWLFLSELARGKRIWAFCDPAQSFWPERKPPRELFRTIVQLQQPYRCPPGIMALADLCIGKTPVDEAPIRAAIQEGTLSLVPCPTRSSVADKLGLEIDKLLGGGLTPGDIALLSVRGQTPAESIIHRESLGRHRVVRADDAELESNVVAETFLRFKGLERPAVIVTDLDLLDRGTAGVRLHIALTRSLVAARVVAAREDLAADPVLSRFIG